MGRLGVSRAFGDKALKPLVVADPDVLTVTLEDGDDFVVLLMPASQQVEFG